MEVRKRERSGGKAEKNVKKTRNQCIGEGQRVDNLDDVNLISSITRGQSTSESSTTRIIEQHKQKSTMKA